MSDPFTTLVDRTRAWFERAFADGWLDEADLARFAAVEHRTPADLFVDQQARPLVVAFFGGTGVGKSSLLNRLAGEAIARTGVERPTSREATVYVHESVELAALPSELPIDAVRIKRHASDAYREVLWIDAPDIDSTEEANRRSALAWLPHVDLVCYVVSPERYRDDVGWRVLRQRGHKHGWMFVLNRWDEGDLRQGDDFARMLSRAGFDDPLLLRTCCLPGRALPSDDQFDQMEAALAGLLKTHGVRELTRLGHRARLQEMRTALHAAEKPFGDDQTWAKLAAFGRQRWHSAAGTIGEGVEWSMRTAAARFAASEGGILGQVKRGVLAARGAHSDTAQSAEEEARDARLDQLTGRLWDDWAQSKLVACLDATELAARRAGLAAGPVRQKLDAKAESAGAQVGQQLRDCVRAALARPGTALGRFVRRITGFLMAFLPVLALLWVGWKVVEGYHEAGRTNTPFLGTDFAIHSALLVLIAWAVPFTVDRLLRPSLERTVLRALRVGLHAGLDDVGQDLERALGESAAEARECYERAGKLLKEVTGWLVKPIDMRVPALSRLMMMQSSGAGGSAPEG